MLVTVSKQNLKDLEAEAIYLALFEGEALTEVATELDQLLDGAIENLLKLKEFKGKLYETALLYTQGKVKTPRVILVGAGKKEEFDATRFVRNIAGAAARRAIRLGVKKLATHLDSSQITAEVVQGIVLANYDTGIYKSKKENTKLEEIILLGADQKAAREAALTAETINWSRHLIAEPANVMTPKRIVEEARKTARDYKLGLEVIDGCFHVDCAR